MLAIDVGASSGRVVRVVFLNDKLTYEEVHRFSNSIIEIDNSYYWDHEVIFNEIEKGITKAGEFDSLGIDTWGVDYVLYNGEKIKYGYSYRDMRSQSFYENSDHQKLFFSTGVAALPFNTVFQLQAEKSTGHFLMVPDYYTFLLTGKFSNEYTNMKTTQLDLNNLEDYNYKFQEVTSLKVFDYEKDSSKKVIQVASHDTASAFIGSPYYTDAIVISLGTWAVIGAITDNVVLNDKAYSKGFSNEGSIENKNRLVKNSVGSWIIEKVLSAFNFNGDYETLIAEVEKLNFIEIIDINDKDFVNPHCMKTAIDKHLSKTDYNMYEYAKIIYDSMISSYVEIINELEEVVESNHDAINIVGGGSQNKYIASKIKEYTGKKVFVGPVESTVIGNSVCQLIALNLVDKSKIKEILFDSEFIEEIL